MRACAHPPHLRWRLVRRKGSTSAPRGRFARRWQSRGRCTGSTRIYQAAAALPHTNRDWATYGLVNQLRIMSVAAGATPDWTTLVVTGPVEVDGAPERARFEWTARVTVRGVRIVDGQPDPGSFPPARGAENATQPFRLDDSSPDRGPTSP